MPSADLTATSASGSGGFMNMAPGVHTIEFIREPEQESDSEDKNQSEYVYGTETILVRAGWLTNARLAPGKLMP